MSNIPGAEVPVDHVVDSVNDAVRLAEQWRADGSHVWFRGQARPWPLIGSLGRLMETADADAEVEAVEARIGSFVRWAEKIPSLKYLLDEEHTDAFFAVLQHYGVPTHYVDFSTDPNVAGFFAAHNPSATPGQQGCIIAIDPGSFVELLRTIAQVKGVAREAWPEQVTVVVDDLWRMQAQSGHFIYLPLQSVENWYGYDRIIFTHDGRPHPIPVEQIYPTRKSSLEIKLDEFFSEELTRNNQFYLNEMFDQWQRQGIRVSHATAEVPDEMAYLQPGSGPHESWSRLDPRWHSSPPQTYSAATGDAPRVDFEVAGDQPTDLTSRVRQAIDSLLAAHPRSRERAVHWVIACDGEIQQQWSERAERVWDGMRGLPYDTGQLAAALAATIELSIPGRRDEADCTVLELASRGGATARAQVSTARIRSAYRDDLRRLLREPALADTPRLLLQVLRNPAFAFDFDKLVELFATSIIPAQVVRYRHDIAVFYSPATVPILGIA